MSAPPLVGRPSPERCVAWSEVHPALHRSVQPDLSPERVSAVAQPALDRSVLLDQSIRLDLRPPALRRGVQPDLSPERANVVPSVARPALHRSVQPDLSPERVSAVPSVARLALDRSVQLDLRPRALDRRASGVERDKRGRLRMHRRRLGRTVLPNG